MLKEANNSHAGYMLSPAPVGVNQLVSTCSKRVQTNSGVTNHRNAAVIKGEITSRLI